MKRRSPAELEAALGRYRDLVERYHGTLDLMSDVGLARFGDHLADAETYVEVVGGISPAPSRVLDLGSGVGLPGVVIAAAFPDLRVELVERRRRRATFLALAVAAVGAKVADVHGTDVGNVNGAPVDVVVAQAVGRFVDVHRLTRHRHAESVVLMARKGPTWRDEVDELAAESGLATDVLAAKPLPHRGTLVAVRVQGGARCRSSG